MRGAGANHSSIVYIHRRWVESFAQSWLSDHIEAFEDEILRQEPANAESLLNTLSDLKNKISDMTIPEDGAILVSRKIYYSQHNVRSTMRYAPRTSLHIAKLLVPKTPLLFRNTP
jgi:hypothetical protein